MLWFVPMPNIGAGVVVVCGAGIGIVMLIVVVTFLPSSVATLSLTLCRYEGLIGVILDVSGSWAVMVSSF